MHHYLRGCHSCLILECDVKSASCTTTALEQRLTAYEVHMGISFKWVLKCTIFTFFCVCHVLMFWVFYGRCRTLSEHEPVFICSVGGMGGCVCVVGGGWCGASSGRKTISLQDNTRAAAVADWSSGSQWTCKKFSPVSVQSVVSERGIHWCIYPLNRPMLRHLCFICHRHPTRPSHFCKITFKDVNVDKFKINCQVFICCVQLCLKLLHKHVLRATSSPISPPHFAVAFGYFLY